MAFLVHQSLSLTSLSTASLPSPSQASHQADIHALRGDIDLARSRLVQSPERLKKTIADLSRSTNNEKATLASFTKKGNELSSKLDQIAQLETVSSLFSVFFLEKER